MRFYGQGAIELSCCSTARTGNCLAHQTIVPLFAMQKEGCRGQGATEYLVLLAVVLIIALVSVALLGFFPGMASDAQMTQSQMYWKSASPISIVESVARVTAASGNTYPYFLIRNTGTYPIRITSLIGGDGGKATQIYNTCEASGLVNFTDYYYLAPGEEKYVAAGWVHGLPCHRYVYSEVGGTSSSNYVRGASSVCQNSTSSPGVLDYKTLGFEYIQYILPF